MVLLQACYKPCSALEWTRGNAGRRLQVVRARPDRFWHAAGTKCTLLFFIVPIWNYTLPTLNEYAALWCVWHQIHDDTYAGRRPDKVCASRLSQGLP
eukprot:3978944-Prymnesium_polylepis.1